MRFHKFSVPALLVVTTLITSECSAFQAPHRLLSSTRTSALSMAGGEGGEAEWMKALLDASGSTPGDFEKKMKMKGLMQPNEQAKNPKLSANAKLVQWLEQEGDVYLSEESSWGEAPHPLAISTETKLPTNLLVVVC